MKMYFWFLFSSICLFLGWEWQKTFGQYFTRLCEKYYCLVFKCFNTIVDLYESLLTEGMWLLAKHSVAQLQTEPSYANFSPFF